MVSNKQESPIEVQRLVFLYESRIKKALSRLKLDP